ncbi:hypothetical protein IAR55_007157 [Kwoniella newhampshirensis]|uniref:Epoxide hydrolase N-terminal domain-containing protein n=1 Tax=Kwoniella newhampshirensis TaxID=1651941 RepID=A0AAW0YD75_9TREE
MSYSTLPHKPTVPLEPFRIAIPEEDVMELKELLKLSRISKETYENTHAEARDGFGVSRDWLIKTKEEWLKFDCLYWFTDCYNSSIYAYRYSLGNKRDEPSAEKEYQKKPVGFSFFPKELAPTPVKWVEFVANVVWSREHKSGGHFAALEKPEELWQDVEEFVAVVWK